MIKTSFCTLLSIFMFWSPYLSADTGCKMLVLEGKPGIVLPGNVIEPTPIPGDWTYRGLPEDRGDLIEAVGNGSRFSPFNAVLGLYAPLFQRFGFPYSLKQELVWGADSFSVDVVEPVGSRDGVLEQLHSQLWSVSKFDENFNYQTAIELDEALRSKVPFRKYPVEDVGSLQGFITIEKYNRREFGEVRLKLTKRAIEQVPQNRARELLVGDLLSYLQFHGVGSEPFQYLARNLRAATAEIESLSQVKLTTIILRWSNVQPGTSQSFGVLHQDVTNEFTGTLPLLGGGTDILLREGNKVRLLRGPTGQLMVMVARDGPFHNGTHAFGKRLVVIFGYSTHDGRVIEFLNND